MNNKSISPNPQQPVDRIPAGQLPSALAELSEAELSARVLPLSEARKTSSEGVYYCFCCSYDGDDE